MCWRPRSSTSSRLTGTRRLRARPERRDGRRQPPAGDAVQQLGLAAGAGRRLDRVVAWQRLDRDPAQLRELLERRPATEPPEAARLHATERHLRLVVDGRVVDVADAAFDPLGQLERRRHVLARTPPPTGRSRCRWPPRTAASGPSTATTVTSGPNDSSAYTRISGVTPVSTVGGKHGPSGSPPLSARGALPRPRPARARRRARPRRG